MSERDPRYRICSVVLGTGIKAEPTSSPSKDESAIVECFVLFDTSQGTYAGNNGDRYSSKSDIPKQNLFEDLREAKIYCQMANDSYVNNPKEFLCEVFEDKNPRKKIKAYQ